MADKREHVLEGGGLRVRFLFDGDRFKHEIWRAAAEGWSLVLASIEGTPLDDWPASPPFQSLNLESRPGDVQLALLVGMAGKSHWSASVSLDSGSATLAFDVACRVRPPASGALGSSYQALVETQGHDLPGTLRLGPAGSGNLELSLAHDLGRAQLECHGGRVNVVAPWSPGRQAATVRWGYRLRFVPQASYSA